MHLTLGKKWPGETERRGRGGEGRVREEGGMKRSERRTKIEVDKDEAAGKKKIKSEQRQRE